MGIFQETLAEGTKGGSHLGPERPRVYSDLSPEEKDTYNDDVRATNILLQVLPKDIYTLINYYTNAKDIWDNTQGETIHDYYVWFAKLINDMRNIKITMSRMQLNSKFMNNMLPEWGRFVIAHYSQSSTTSPSAYVPPHLADNAHLDSGLSPTDNLNKNLTNTLALLTQSYKRFLPQTNNQLRTSSNIRNQATVQDGRVVVQNVQGQLNIGQGNNPQGGGTAGYEGAHNRVGNANPAQENRVALDEEQLLFLACGQVNAIDKDVDEQPVHDIALNVDNVFQVDDCNAFDSDVDEAPTAQTMFMEKLSSADSIYDEVGPSYDLDILSKVHDHDHYQDAICEHHEEHEMNDNVQPNHVVDSHADYTSDSNMIPYDQYVKDNAVPVVQTCIHDMVDKLAFMAWLLSCLCSMDGKVSEIGSKETRMMMMIIINKISLELRSNVKKVRPWNKAHCL
nr:hypothetical protein [Tanacetum cinerariifolium]